MHSFFKSSITKSVAGTLLSTLIITLVAYATHLTLGEIFVIILQWLWRMLIRIITFPIPVWVVVVGLGILKVFAYVRKTARNVVNEQLKVTDYRRDVIYDVLWEWDWYAGHDGKLALTHDSPFSLCPKCMNELIVIQHSIYDAPFLLCQNCNFTKVCVDGTQALKEKVEREILRRGRTGAWKERITQLHSS